MYYLLWVTISHSFNTDWTKCLRLHWSLKMQKWWKSIFAYWGKQFNKDNIHVNEQLNIFGHGIIGYCWKNGRCTYGGKEEGVRAGLSKKTMPQLWALLLGRQLYVPMEFFFSSYNLPLSNFYMNILNSRSSWKLIKKNRNHLFPLLLLHPHVANVSFSSCFLSCFIAKYMHWKMIILS